MLYETEPEFILLRVFSWKKCDWLSGKVLIKKETDMKTMYSFSIAAITINDKQKQHILKLHTSMIFQFQRSEVQCGSLGATIQVLAG